MSADVYELDPVRIEKKRRRQLIAVFTALGISIVAAWVWASRHQ